MEATGENTPVMDVLLAQDPESLLRVALFLTSGFI